MALLGAFEFRLFVKWERATYYSAEEASILLWGENDDGELKSGTSEEEEAKLEHQLQIFREESRKAINIYWYEVGWVALLQLAHVQFSSDIN